MEPAALLELFADVASAIRAELDELADWGRAHGHDSQYQHDVVADAVAVPMLTAAGLGVVSEESPPVAADAEIVAVMDPIDGSTNASMALPWFATSICAVDAEGPLAALVINQAIGVTYTAIRGEGARRDGARIAPSMTTELGDAMVVFNDLPPRHFGWRQYRVLGAAALDLCAVADGTVDAFVDLGSGLAPWDYLGGLLICREAGATVAPLHGGDLVTADPSVRIQPVAAGTEALADALVAAAR